MLEHERIALVVIAVITATLAVVETRIAVIAASTALQADALSFIQHSLSAGFALRSGSGYRPRWTVHVQGIIMILLGGLVGAIAFSRTLLGSTPYYPVMTIMGLIALVGHISVCAIMLQSRGQLNSLFGLWRFSRADAMGNIAVIAAAAAVALTSSNIPDIVIGAAMAGLFLLAGWRIALSGRVDAGQAR